jgi:hypothetical protein
MIIFANPSTRPKRAKTATKARKPRAVKKGASAMAKKHRSPAQRAATKRMLAANRSRKRHRNPTTRHATRRRSASVAAPKRRRRVHRNPSLFGGGMGVLGELMTKEGLLMIGGAFVAPMVADFVQEKIMPSATGWTKILVKAGVVAAGAWAIDKFGRQRKAALAFGVTGAAVLASDAVRLYRGQMAGLSEGEADYLATRPELMQAYVNAGSGMGENWQVGLSEPYRTGLADAFAPAFG